MCCAVLPSSWTASIRGNSSPAMSSHQLIKLTDLFPQSSFMRRTVLYPRQRIVRLVCSLAATKSLEARVIPSPGNPSQVKVVELTGCNALTALNDSVNVSVSTNTWCDLGGNSTYWTELLSGRDMLRLYVKSKKSFLSLHDFEDDKVVLEKGVL